jgi:hypothetical protein
LQSINLLIGPDPSPEGEGFTDPPSGTLNRSGCVTLYAEVTPKRTSGGYFRIVTIHPEPACEGCCNPD